MLASRDAARRRRWRRDEREEPPRLSAATRLASGVRDVARVAYDARLIDRLNGHDPKTEQVWSRLWHTCSSCEQIRRQGDVEGCHWRRVNGCHWRRVRVREAIWTCARRLLDRIQCRLQSDPSAASIVKRDKRVGLTTVLPPLRMNIVWSDQPCVHTASLQDSAACVARGHLHQRRRGVGAVRASG